MLQIYKLYLIYTNFYRKYDNHIYDNYKNGRKRMTLFGHFSFISYLCRKEVR